MFKKSWVLNDINKYCCKCICTPSLTTKAHFTLSREIICLTCTARLKLHDDEQRLSKKNITKSSQPNGYAATEWIMDLCSCILQILRNFQPPLGFFLITSIFSCLSGVVVGVLIQSNERRDNDPPFFCYPAEDPRRWAIIGAGRPVLSGDLCWFLGKMELWYFLWSLDDELPLSHRYW